MSGSTFTGVFEAAVDHSAQELRLEDEVSEVGGVDADVVSPSKTVSAARAIGGLVSESES